MLLKRASWPCRKEFRWKELSMNLWWTLDENFMRIHENFRKNKWKNHQNSMEFCWNFHEILILKVLDPLSFGSSKCVPNERTDGPDVQPLPSFVSLSGPWSVPPERSPRELTWTKKGQRTKKKGQRRVATGENGRAPKKNDPINGGAKKNQGVFFSGRYPLVRF